MKTKIEQEIMNTKALIDEREEKKFKKIKIKLRSKSHYTKDEYLLNRKTYING